MLRVKTVTSWNKKMSGVSITCLRVRVVVWCAKCVVCGGRAVVCVGAGVGLGKCARQARVWGSAKAADECNKSFLGDPRRALRP